jgi:hypothetical protein
MVPGAPLVANVGDLPLIVWRNPVTHSLSSTINICKHMGSRLNNAKITSAGCLKCQYHGYEYEGGGADTVGQVIEHEGKIFWSYMPYRPLPHSIPYYHNTEYETSHLQIDMDASLIDSALNTMDIRHPEYIHRLGFGSNNPPQNIKHYMFDHVYTQSVGLSFDYVSNPVMRTLNDRVKTTQNFHMYVYPTFSWSHVRFSRKSLIIGVNLLPLAPDRTRWFVTVVHNYYKSDIGKRLMQTLTNTILKQDQQQMRNQATDSPLKRDMLFSKTFKDEEVVVQLHTMFKKYRYPDTQMVMGLYNDISKNT